MWELDYKESWVLKNWCFWTVVLEKTLESPLDCKKIQPVHPRDQSWVFILRTDAEAAAPILWAPDAKNWLIWKDSDAGKDWRQEDKGLTEDEIVGWHHQLLEFTQTHVPDAIQLSHPLSSPSPPALNLSQHPGLFKWVSSLHQVLFPSPGIFPSQELKHTSHITGRFFTVWATREALSYTLVFLVVCFILVCFLVSKLKANLLYL